MDPVALLLDFTDETWCLTETLSRWEAELVLRCIGEYGLPFRGKSVKEALIVPWEPETFHD